MSNIKTAPIKVGFGPRPGVKCYVFVGADDGSEATDTYVWYILDSDGKKIPIHDGSLTGWVTNIRVVPRQWKGKWGYKVDTTLVADRLYVLRSGISTSFAKGMVNSLSTVPDLEKLITINAKKGDEGKVVFGDCSDPETGKSYFCEKQETKLGPVVFKLQERLGLEVQSFDSIAAEIKEEEAKQKR